MPFVPANSLNGGKLFGALGSLVTNEVRFFATEALRHGENLQIVLFSFCFLCVSVVKASFSRNSLPLVNRLPPN